MKMRRLGRDLVLSGTPDGGCYSKEFNPLLAQAYNTQSFVTYTRLLATSLLPLARIRHSPTYPVHHSVSETFPRALMSSSDHMFSCKSRHSQLPRLWQDVYSQRPELFQVQPFTALKDLPVPGIWAISWRGCTRRNLFRKPSFRVVAVRRLSGNSVLVSRRESQCGELFPYRGSYTCAPKCAAISRSSI
jgi:hypothetical protein